VLTGSHLLLDAQEIGVSCAPGADTSEEQILITAREKSWVKHTPFVRFALNHAERRTAAYGASLPRGNALAAAAM